MKNALHFFGTKDLFNFGEMPIFKSFFGDFVPSNFTNSPKVNVKETDKAYEIEIANPGFGKDDTKIEVKDGVIYVSMNLETETKDDEKMYAKKDELEKVYQPIITRIYQESMPKDANGNPQVDPNMFGQMFGGGDGANGQGFNFDPSQFAQAQPKN